MKLTEQQRLSLLSWLTDRYDEMRPDAKSIREEDPHLMPAIRAAMKALAHQPAAGTEGSSDG